MNACSALRLAPALIRSIAANSQSKQIHLSATPFAGGDWRKERGMPANPSDYGPLTDLPDYTFLDGRRTPASHGKLKRAQKQQELATKIMELSSEIDFAIDRRKRLDTEQEQERESILHRKLKPKGDSRQDQKSQRQRRQSEDSDSD